MEIGRSGFGFEAPSAIVGQTYGLKQKRALRGTKPKYVKK
jgi:hypothetical protein